MNPVESESERNDDDVLFNFVVFSPSTSSFWLICHKAIHKFTVYCLSYEVSSGIYVVFFTTFLLG